MGVNKAILLGNLGKDPEVRYTQAQMAICNFSLATGERKKDQTGTWVDHTEWHNIVTFGKTAENCAQYLKKGKQVYIEGKIQTRKWQDKEGRDRYTTEILANTVQFIGGARGTDTSASNDSGEASMPSHGSHSAPASHAVTAPEVAMAANGGAAPQVSFDDDDIPF